MARTRKSRSPEKPVYREALAFPTLVALVAGLVLFGVMHYSLLLAAGSVIIVGFFSWLWWHRHQSRNTPTTARSPRASSRKRKHA